MRFSHFSPAMPRSLFVAALVAVAPALSVHAQTARTDTAPVRAAETLSASADARLPLRPSRYASCRHTSPSYCGLGACATTAATRQLR